MTRQCAGKRRDGRPCTATVNPPQTYCWWHDPAYASERQHNARKAGRARGGSEISELKAELKVLFDGVKAGSIPTSVGSVCAQIGGVRMRVLELERKVKESEEFDQRLSQLEEAAASAGRRYAR